MAKTYYPFTLHHFTTPKNDQDKIRTEITGLLDLIVRKQEIVLREQFTDAIDQAVENPELLKVGSVSRLGQKLGLTPTFNQIEKQEYKHLYSIKEMVRANLGSLVGSYIQRHKLFTVISNLPDANPKDIAVAYKKLTGKRISLSQIERTLNALRKSGSVDNLPSSPRKLSLWATDTHHSKLTSKGRSLTLSMKLSKGPVELVFHVPHHVPIEGVKFSRPTIMQDHKGKLTFGFTAEKTVVSPNPNPAGWLGGDLGVVKNYTATAVREDSFSQSWSDTKQIKQVTEQINVLKTLRSHNLALASQNKERYGTKSLAQYQEARRLGAKISRLKNYRAHLIANKLVQIARLNNLGIALEDLAWVPNSHWEQGLVQQKIMDEAIRYSVLVKKVNAKNTSKTCSRCGKLDTTFSGRTLICKVCDYRADRDVNASRNIAMKALKLKTCPLYKKNYYSKFSRWHSRSTTGVGYSLSETPLVDTPTISINSQQLLLL